MFHKRKDNGCESRILAFNPNIKYGVLIEARWPPKNRNIVHVSREYFMEKYGVDPANG